MRAIHYLIDCAGETMASPFQPLRGEIGGGLSHTALIDCAVNNLGYVHVQEWPRGLVVSYSSGAITPVTLVGAIYLLAKLVDKRVIFSVVDGLPRYTLYRTRSQAIGRLVGEMHRIETQPDHAASEPRLLAYPPEPKHVKS